MPVFLTLGEVTFANTEVPEKMPFGGDQSTHIHRLLGGERVIDLMGRDDRDIEWDGMFFGTTATFRARYLDAMRVQGKPLNLSWSQFNFTVILKSFRPDFQRTNVIPYSIKVEIIQDLNKPFPVLLPVTYDTAVFQIMQEAKFLAEAISDGDIEAQLAVLAYAINLAGSLDNAASSVISKIVGPLSTLTDTISKTINTTSAGIFG
jgi:hypothetical protein